MSDITFLRDFSAQPAKPVKQDLATLSASYAYSDAKSSGSTPLPVQARSYSNVKSPAPAQKYSNVSVDDKQVEVDSAVDTIAEESSPEVKEETTDIKEEPVKSIEKFAHGVVGDVPPGYKAAQACCNCNYQSVANFTCTKHNFPVTYNYTCDDFKMLGSDTEKYSNQLVETVQEVNHDELELSPLDKVVADYEVVLSTFADGELASLALDKVVNRFSNRSDYADAFLRLKYRRFYEDKHGSLEGAFVNPQEDN
jgi:hypothetical protein